MIKYLNSDPDGCEPITELTHSSPTGIIKQSYTSLEVDSYVSHIVNEFKNAGNFVVSIILNILIKYEIYINSCYFKLIPIL